MSNAFAIAAVTAALRSLVQEALSAASLDGVVGGNPAFSSLPPDRVAGDNGSDPLQVNLYLYSMTPNAAWRNESMPLRDHRGNRQGASILAVDLRYLLTAYAPADFGAEVLLGHCAQAFHERPFLDREWLESALTNSPPNGIPSELAQSGIAHQIEQIRITPERISLDDVSKIWTAMQGRYRTSLAYLVRVALIEPEVQSSGPLPVAERRFGVIPHPGLSLTDARAVTGRTAPVTAGTEIELIGQGLHNRDLLLFVDNAELTSTISLDKDSRLTFSLPDPLPQGIRAGLRPVQVGLHTDAGIVRSNPAGLLIRPRIQSVSTTSGAISVDFDPPVDATARVTLFLNELPPGAGETLRSAHLSAPAENGITSPATETGSINFDASAIPAATWLVRVQIDGAESLLIRDASGQYTQPLVTTP